MPGIRRLGVASSLAVLVLTGCGSGLTAHPATQTAAAQGGAPSSTTAGATPHAARAPDLTFAVVLTGTSTLPTGRVVHASLSARLHLLGSRGMICWTFTKVSGVEHPTSAYIHDDFGDLLARLGPHYKAAGCAPISQSSASQISVDARNSELTVVSEHFTTRPLFGTL
jgi:hypothetical protein